MICSWFWWYNLKGLCLLYEGYKKLQLHTQRAQCRVKPLGPLLCGCLISRTHSQQVPKLWFSGRWQWKDYFSSNQRAELWPSEELSVSASLSAVHMCQFHCRQLWPDSSSHAKGCQKKTGRACFCLLSWYPVSPVRASALEEKSFQISHWDKELTLDILK